MALARFASSFDQSAVERARDTVAGSRADVSSDDQSGRYGDQAVSIASQPDTVETGGDTVAIDDVVHRHAGGRIAGRERADDEHVDRREQGGSDHQDWSGARDDRTKDLQQRCEL